MKLSSIRGFRYVTLAFFGALLVWNGTACSQATGAFPTDLRCELLRWPERTELSDPRPEFSWALAGGCAGQTQRAYHILLASTVERLHPDKADLWDSGKVDGADSTAVAYAGRPLQSNATYVWTVRFWDDRGQASAWASPQTIRTGTLTDSHRTARYPLVKTAVAPIHVVKTAEKSYFIDFGKAAFGTVRLTLNNTSDQVQQIKVGLGEVPAGKHQINRDPGGARRYRQMKLAVRPGTHEYVVNVTPDKRNTGSAAILMPAEIGEVMPFRYCEIEDWDGSLLPSQIRQIAVHYPFDEQASLFRCSDPILNDVWQLCKYSIKATSFCGVYVDGDRERIPYEADAYLNQLSHYCVDSEYSMARYTHEYLMTHPTWPTEWILHSVLMAWADYLYSGDRESLAAFYEDLKAKTLLSLAREDGLISTHGERLTDEVLKSIHINQKIRDIVDWPHGSLGAGKHGESDGYEFGPINTVVNAFHYRALVLMAKIAEVMEQPAEASAFADRAERVKKAINTKLFNTAEGRYVDGEHTRHSSLHANMFPLAFGLVPAEHQKSVVDFIKSRGMACSVYGAQYLMESLYQAGEAEYALQLMTDRNTDRNWAHMVYDVGTTITLEAWDDRYKPNQDWNHAWGAAPANIIPTYLMGIRPVEPGFAAFEVKPQVASLTSGEIRFPTIRGAIEMAFSAQPQGSFSMRLVVPGNTRATVFVPGPSGQTQVRINGTLTEGQVDGPYIRFDRLPAGLYVFERNAVTP